ncbi:hypothetical_protein (plasmid) [Leishmania braziliensis MHOM/BR/75/M2904]|uniref:Hypothetical_protein n=1 Tax=Leishmania braziliensis MHOM/BR/75/M2904 TaxID=420245 RepID=A0A3P3Z2D1_LEIBR|nr:hypothetical_protein [Leishmania braziliensis MHOM/BR/75/M2904]
MSQNMLAETVPLFGAAGRRSYDVFPTAAQRRHPFIMAIGSSCNVQRATDGTTYPFISALAPSVCPRSRAYSAATAHQQPLSSRSAGPRRSNERRCGGSRRLSWNTHFSQLLSEEQITRWRLRCKEQEERVEIALAKPSCWVLFSDAHTTAAHSSRERGSACLSCGAYSRPRLPRSEPVCAMVNEVHSLGAGRRRIKTKKHCSSGRSGDFQEQPSSGTRDAASATAPLHVRDSELLRALQRAEARIKQLETGIVPQTAALGEEESVMSASSSTTVRPQASTRPGPIHPYTPLSPYLVTL